MPLDLCKQYLDDEIRELKQRQEYEIKHLDQLSAQRKCVVHEIEEQLVKLQAELKKIEAIQ